MRYEQAYGLDRREGWLPFPFTIELLLGCLPEFKACVSHFIQIANRTIGDGRRIPSFEFEQIRMRNCREFSSIETRGDSQASDYAKLYPLFSLFRIPPGRDPNSMASSRFQVVISDFITDSLKTEQQIIGDIADVTALDAHSERELMGRIEQADAIMLRTCESKAPKPVAMCCLEYH